MPDKQASKQASIEPDRGYGNMTCPKATQGAKPPLGPPCPKPNSVWRQTMLVNSGQKGHLPTAMVTFRVTASGRRQQPCQRGFWIYIKIKTKTGKVRFLLT
ncbi:hypothetical protein ElyMa_005201200 [Elysia marginata]|uniref:Uncharacterized protein n=1 Tax=Elysia marginata TaxID=1093978 RepID=A0AAV4JXG0_9GAST|nr:hypothetical protein ElyMa_005201200 [Elysia marginata]